MLKHGVLAGLVFVFLLACTTDKSTDVFSGDTQQLDPFPMTTPNMPLDTEWVELDIEPESVARYLVREQLARRNLPNDAIGTTNQVSGAIIFNADGSIDSKRSVIIVDLASLRSDSSRRDNFLRKNTLKTDEFPTIEVIVKSTPGLTWPLPTSGQDEFEIVGDMTIHGVTSQIRWQATAEFSELIVRGKAKTNFTFDRFGLEIPRVYVVLSVEDNIRLEIDFSASVSRRQHPEGVGFVNEYDELAIELWGTVPR